MQVVQQMENNLAKEKSRLSAMMAHLHMTRERRDDAKPEPPVSGTKPGSECEKSVKHFSCASRVLSGP